MTVTGLKVVVIGFVYMLLPTVVSGGVLLVGVLGAGVSGDGVIAGLGLLGAMLGGCSGSLSRCWSPTWFRRHWRSSPRRPRSAPDSTSER